MLNMSPYLYFTTTPVLLGGKRQAGRLARHLWQLYGRTSHWFGHGYHYLLTAYSEKHPLPRKISAMSDALLTQILIDFAKEQPEHPILPLIPCSDTATAYLERARSQLEPYFVIFPQEISAKDPLSLLLISQRNENI